MSAESFLTRLNLADRKVREAARKGMAKGCMRLLGDAVMEAEKVPIDEGTLRGSGSVFVGNTLIGTSEASGGGLGTPARSLGIQTAGGQALIGTVGFNTPYAAWLHEHPELNFSEEGTGAKYLEKKMSAHRERYMGIVAGEVRKVMG